MSMDNADSLIEGRLNILGILTSEMHNAKLEVAIRLRALMKVRALSHREGYLHWSDAAIVCRIVADNFRRRRVVMMERRKSDFRLITRDDQDTFLIPT
jgi:hypothetical protein